MLLKPVKFKHSNKLFLDRYQYKIVLVSAGVHAFRSGNLDHAFKILSEFNPSLSQDYRFYNRYITQDNIDYLFEIYEVLLHIQNYSVRVESPWLSIYTNSLDDIKKLNDLNSLKVKEIYETPAYLTSGECHSTLPYDYKVLIKQSKSKQPVIAFYDWAVNNKNIRLPKSCESILKGESYSTDSYFYVKGDHNLTVCRLHLGSLIKKTQKIVNQVSSV